MIPILVQDLCNPGHKHRFFVYATFTTFATDDALKQIFVQQILNFQFFGHLQLCESNFSGNLRGQDLCNPRRKLTPK